MNRVVLVGNDVSMRDHELGDLIDSHDIVIRFSWYDINPEREKHFGSKTDVWATTLYDPIRAKRKYNFIYQYSFSARAGFDPVFKQIQSAQEGEFGAKGYNIYRPFGRVWMDMGNYLNKARGIPRKLYEEPSEFVKYSSVSTLAWILLHHGDEEGMLGKYRGEDEDSEIPVVTQLSVCGFDWWGMSKGSAICTDGAKVGKNWQQQMELDLFGMLWLSGKIRDLNPDSDFHQEPRK